MATVGLAGDQGQDRPLAGGKRLRIGAGLIGPTPPDDTGEAVEIEENLGRKVAGNLHRDAAEGPNRAGLIGGGRRAGAEAKKRRARMQAEAV